MTTISKLTFFFLLLCAPAFGATCVETGQVAADTADATTTINHSCGEAPKAIILWGTQGTANTDTTSGTAGWCFGFSDGTNHRGIAWASDSGTNPTNVGRTFRTDRACELLSDGTPTTLRYISDTTMGSTTVDLVFDGTPAAAYLFGYMILGGSDIAAVSIGTHTLDTATGSDSITGLSFQPEFGLFINCQTTASGTGADVMCGLGFAASSTKEFAMCWGIDDAASMDSTVDSVAYTDQAATMCGITSGAETIDLLADFTSYNSDGATWNISNAPTAAWLVGYLLVDGGQWDVGTTTLPTSGAARTISGMTFQPKGLALAFANPTADATVTTNADNRPSSAFGAAVSTSTEVAIGLGKGDSLASATRRQIHNDVVSYSSYVGSSGQVFTQFNSDGWVITDEGSGITASQAGWFAVGDNAVAAPRKRVWMVY